MRMLGKLIGVGLCILIYAGFVCAQGLTVASPHQLQADVLLEELDESSTDWRVLALRISVHEQMFRTGKKAVEEPALLRGIVVTDELLKKAIVKRGMGHLYEPMSLEERLAHLHTAIELLTSDWWSFSFEEEDPNEMLHMTKLLLGRLYDTGAPHLLDVEIEWGSTLKKTRYPVVFHQDTYAQFHIDAMRPLADDAIGGMWSSDLVSMARLCGADDAELMKELRNRSALFSLAEASEMYESVVLIGDRVLVESDEPWESRYWEPTRTAAKLWLDLERRREQVDPDYEKPRRETASLAKKWLELKSPKAGQR
ncbi:MAG: hypothetical protein Phyf2KO_14800 [Phycisphaerales bacterium]